MLLCHRIKNEHGFGAFALELRWKTFQSVTCGLHLGKVETEHLCSEPWQSSPLKALPEIPLLSSRGISGCKVGC